MAVAVARYYLRETHPDWYKEIKDLKHLDVVDAGNIWEVRVPVPGDRLGGGPVVEVDKDSFHVIRAYHEQ
jgi:hypothetical protein